MAAQASPSSLPATQCSRRELGRPVVARTGDSHFLEGEMEMTRTRTQRRGFALGLIAIMALGLVAGAQASTSACTWDAGTSFSPVAPLNGVWSYGWKDANGLTSPVLNLHPQLRIGDGGLT